MTKENFYEIAIEEIKKFPKGCINEKDLNKHMECLKKENKTRGSWMGLLMLVKDDPKKIYKTSNYLQGIEVSDEDLIIDEKITGSKMCFIYKYFLDKMMEENMELLLD